MILTFVYRFKQNSISDKATHNNCLAITHVLCCSCRACPALVRFPVSTECFKLYRSLVYCIRHCFNVYISHNIVLRSSIIDIALSSFKILFARSLSVLTYVNIHTCCITSLTGAGMLRILGMHDNDLAVTQNCLICRGNVSSGAHLTSDTMWLYI